MSVWLTESEFRSDLTAQQSITLNVAFLHEIKQDQVELKLILDQIEDHLASPSKHDSRTRFESISQLRDELETYFALEEFYGYFESARITHPKISKQADLLKSQHESLFVQICGLVELAESIYYRELPELRSLRLLRERYRAFLRDFKQHEQQEMQLMLSVCNDDIGVGD